MNEERGGEENASQQTLISLFEVNKLCKIIPSVTLCEEAGSEATAVEMSFTDIIVASLPASSHNATLGIILHNLFTSNKEIRLLANGNSRPLKNKPRLLPVCWQAFSSLPSPHPPRGSLRSPTRFREFAARFSLLD